MTSGVRCTLTNASLYVPYPASHMPEHAGFCSWDELPKVPSGHGHLTPRAQKDPGSQGLLPV